MRHYLVLRIGLHDRFHGMGPKGAEWPPSPARVFQALVAGGAIGRRLPGDVADGLAWLEGLAPPTIAAPRATLGDQYRLFVPNNDADALPDPLERSSIRVGKIVCARIPAHGDLYYAWRLDDGGVAGQAAAILDLASSLYQLGRGPDMAWASGELVPEAEFARLLDAYEGVVYEPSMADGAIGLAVPVRGSLDSLTQRHAAFLGRLQSTRAGRTATELFRQPPKGRFQQVAYLPRFARFLYELHCHVGDASRASWPLSSAHVLVVALRDRAVARLQHALPERAADIARVLIGRRPDGSIDSRPEDRVRIVPLPSIGHQHADHAIRRVLVEVPPGCLLRSDDVRWAFSGLEFGNEVPGAVLVPAADERFLHHFGLGDSGGSCAWRTVTPAALPESARRRRIDPARLAEQAKPGTERAEEHARAAGAVCHALRHAGVSGRVASVRVQREHFHRNGDRVEAFAAGTRFDKDRLWHVEVRFIHPVQGPLVIGDGRYLGLGVMAPVTGARDLHVFEIVSGLGDLADPGDVARALRRAVMARAQLALGTRSLPGYFSGHAADGAPAQSSELPHLAYAFEPTTARLAIIAPYLLDRREASREEHEHQGTLDRALEDLVELRAGSAGCLTLRTVPVDAEYDDLTRPSREWWSATPYVVTRHARLGDAAAALESNLRDECRRCGLPEPSQVDVCVETRAGRPLAGRATLRFQTAVRGPIALGRTRFAGGGLFVARRGGVTG